MFGDHRSSRRRRRSARLAVVALVAVALAAAGAALAWNMVGRAAGDDPLAPAQLTPVATAAPTVTAAPKSSTPPVAGASLPPRPHIVAHPRPVPILVYHHVYPHVLPRHRGSPLVVMGVRRFRAQLRYLAAHGYRAVTLRRVYDAWTGEGTLPPKPVVITFDDGYADQVRNAAPILREHAWPAELDLVYNALYLGSNAPPGSLTPDMVKGLLDDGWGLESHSVSHADLTRLHGAALRRELLTSRRRLEALFDVRIDFFCYPYGIYSRRIKLAVRRAGYLAATGTRFGAATPRELFALPRIYCYGGESLRVLGERLRGTLKAAGG